MACVESDEGKERIKYNSQKGGLYVKGLLTCTDKCLYRNEICPAYEMLVEGYGGRTFTGTCILETISYMNIKDHFYDNSLYDGINADLIEEYTMVNIRIDRLRRYISMFPDITVQDGHIGQVHLLLHRLQKKLLNLIIKIRGMTNNPAPGKGDGPFS